MKVVVFGTFDILHPGHLNMFRQAKGRGDFLIAVVGRDSTVKKIKGKKPVYDEKERVENLKRIPLIDKVVLGHEGDKYSILVELKPDRIALGYDQDSFTEGLKEELKKRGLKAEIVRLKPYCEDVYKSSKFR